jgi:hypothetical protein
VSFRYFFSEPLKVNCFLWGNRAPSGALGGRGGEAPSPSVSSGEGGKQEGVGDKELKKCPVAAGQVLTILFVAQLSYLQIFSPDVAVWCLAPFLFGGFPIRMFFRRPASLTVILGISPRQILSLYPTGGSFPRG